MWCDKMWSGDHDDVIRYDNVTTCEAEMMWCKAMMMIRQMWSNDYDVIRCEEDMMWSRYDDVINW